MIKGLFICLGDTRPPSLELLGPEGIAGLNDRLGLRHVNADKARLDAYRMTFGVGTNYAIPAWRPEAVELLATKYAGAYAAEVLDLCRQVSLRFRNSRDSSGNGNAKPIPKPDAPPSPSGALFPEFSNVAQG